MGGALNWGVLFTPIQGKEKYIPALPVSQSDVVLIWDSTKSRLVLNETQTDPQNRQSSGGSDLSSPRKSACRRKRGRKPLICEQTVQ